MRSNSDLALANKDEMYSRSIKDKFHSRHHKWPTFQLARCPLHSTALMCSVRVFFRMIIFIYIQMFLEKTHTRTTTRSANWVSTA